MEAISAQCGVAIITQERLHSKSGEPMNMKVFCFPQDEGENFLFEWLLGLETGYDADEEAAAWQRAMQATGMAEDDNNDIDDLEEKLYEGDRSVLEPLLRSSWDRLGPSFQQLPNTAQWTIQRFTDVGTDNGDAGLMPVLCDDENFHLLLPTSAECIGRTGALTMPDPYHARDPAAGHRDYMCRDVWFEDCGDGGAYVLGLDDTVLIFYVDGPGDMVYGRWQCSRGQWETMWQSAFGSRSVTVES